MTVLQPLREFGTPLADISQIMPFGGVQQAFDEFLRAAPFAATGSPHSSTS